MAEAGAGNTFHEARLVALLNQQKGGGRKRGEWRWGGKEQEKTEGQGGTKFMNEGRQIRRERHGHKKHTSHKT